MKIAVFIVAYNAVNTLSKVLDRIPKDFRSRIQEVYVFDDSSSDDTYLVGQGYKATHPDFPNLQIFRNHKNLGYGGNQKLGYRYAIEKGFDIVALLHGDGQYAPEVLPELVRPLEEGGAEAVFGSRMLIPGAALKGHMPLYKYAGNKVLTAFENRMLGMSLSEFHSGYRLYSVAALKELPFEKNSDDFHFDTEIIIQLHAKHFRIKELPVPTYYGKEICHVNGLKYAWNCARAVLQYRGHCRGLAYHEKFDLGQVRYTVKKDIFSSHSKAALLVPKRGQKILDVGSAGGELAAMLKGEDNELFGVDRVEPPDAQKNFKQFFVKDLDLDFSLPFRAELDWVLFLDVLEHLRDPGKVLSGAERYLKPGGKILACVPNFENWSVRLQILFGRFRYSSKGILDATHLRFFTLKTAKELLEKNGYFVEKVDATPLPLTDVFPVFNNPLLKWIHYLSYGLSRLWKSLFAYQIVLVGRKR